MTELNGLMMDDYPLSLTHVVERAERFTPKRDVVARRPDGDDPSGPTTANAPTGPAGSPADCPSWGSARAIAWPR